MQNEKDIPKMVCLFRGAEKYFVALQQGVVARQPLLFFNRRITRNSREPLVIQGFLLTYIYITKKDIPCGYIFFRGAEKGI